MTKPLYFYNGSSFELVGPTTPQSPIAYQTSAPTAPATGDLWIDSDGDVDTYNRQLTRYYFVATAGQTSVSGVDANGLTLAYVAGSEAVYVNGALQVRGQDYTATNGTSVTGLTALAVNDVVEIFAYTAFTVANAYTKSETDGLVGSAAGLKLLTPTSVAVGSGSGSVGTSGTVTFSGASSVSLNGVFSATYKSYKVVYKGTQSAQDTFALRVRANGTDLTSSVYKSMVMWNTSASGTFSSQGSDGATSIDILGGGVQSGYYIFDINDIFEAKRTAILERAQMMINSSNTSYNITGAAQVYNTTSYDGLTFIPGSGTITGTISVYGYKD
jgi:hypothetical protein